MKILEKPANYTVFDLETTGLDWENDSIIEIGAVKVQNHKIVKKFSQFCFYEFELSPIVKEITGISSEDLKNAPKKTQVLKEFIKFIGNDILIGHNLCKFDILFLNSELQRIGVEKLKNDMLDTLSLSYTYTPEMQNHKLISLLNYYNIEYDVLHRALDDAIATHKLFEKML